MVHQGGPPQIIETVLPATTVGFPVPMRKLVQQFALNMEAAIGFAAPARVRSGKRNTESVESRNRFKWECVSSSLPTVDVWCGDLSKMGSDDPGNGVSKKFPNPA